MGRCKAVFSFLYLKKIKISKIYVRFGKFQKYTPVALWGATGLKCNFFSSNLQRSPWKKEGPVAPPKGRQGPVAHPSGDQPVGLAYRRQGGRSPLLRATGGACRPPRATGSGRLYKASPSFPPLIWPQKSKKIQKKKRGEKKGSGEALPNSALVIYR